MSHSSDNKIELFRQEIMAKASAERDTILKETEQAKQQELDREQTRQLEEIYQLMQTEISQIKLENARVLSTETRRLRQELYRQRELYLTELMARARAELVAFTATPAYETFLVDTARRLAGEYTGAALELREQDLSFAPALGKVFPGEILACTVPIAIGGMRLVERARGLCVDCTLDSALETQRDWFHDHSHLSVEQGGE